MMKVIAIAGASASGKTYIAKALYQHLTDQFGSASVASMSEDSYYNHTPHLEIEERAKLNFDHPDAFEHSLLTEHLTRLKQGQTIEQPQYCYKTHLRLQQTIEIKPTQWLILEGMHLFHNSEIYNMFNFKIYVKTPIDICLERRIVRDKKQRQRTEESIIKQFESAVRPMFLKFIDPSKKIADVIIDGTKNKSENMQILSKLIS